MTFVDNELTIKKRMAEKVKEYCQYVKKTKMKLEIMRIFTRIESIRKIIMEAAEILNHEFRKIQKVIEKREQ